MPLANCSSSPSRKKELSTYKIHSLRNCTKVPALGITFLTGDSKAVKLRFPNMSIVRTIGISGSSVSSLWIDFGRWQRFVEH